MWNCEEENESPLNDDRIDKSFLTVIEHNCVVNIEKGRKYSPIFQIVSHCENKYKKLVIHKKNVAKVLFQYL